MDWNYDFFGVIDFADFVDFYRRGGARRFRCEEEPLMPLLEVKNLTVGFSSRDEQQALAVDDVSFSLDKGEVLGIVGESGSGKSVTALSILGLLPYPKAYHLSQSSITFNGLELLNAQENLLRGIRGSKIGFIFQEPMSSLNP